MKPLRTKAARIYGDIIEKSRPEDEDSRIRHPRMPIPDRAKIFAPFAALTGYEKVIDQKSAEALLVPRPILAEDKLEALSVMLGQLQKGQTVQVAFFRQETTGEPEHPSTDSPSCSRYSPFWFPWASVKVSRKVTPAKGFPLPSSFFSVREEVRNRSTMVITCSSEASFTVKVTGSATR